MNHWAADPEPRIGPSTLQALGLLAASPPSVVGLPRGDFWSLIGKYMSRVFAESDVQRVFCEEHLIARYRPHLGAQENAQRLVKDIRALGSDGYVAVSTAMSCWTILFGAESCVGCAANAITNIYSPIRPGEKSNELADVWRRTYLLEHPSDWSLLEGFAAEMFPAIEFSKDAWGRLNTLVGGPEETVVSVIDHLAVLNDLAAGIWNDEITSQGREAAMGAKGVSASLESPKTHRNKAAMKARDFRFEHGVESCEWHTKLRPETNRIYFAVKAEKVLVGIIVDHLPT